MINNALTAGKKTCIVKPVSNLLLNIFNIMKENGYINDFRRIDDQKQGVLRIFLKYTSGNESFFTEVNRVSKSSLRVYTKWEEIFKKWGKRTGLTIFSTSQGVMSAEQASEKHLGGEVLCYIR